MVLVMRNMIQCQPWQNKLSFVKERKKGEDRLPWLNWRIASTCMVLGHRRNLIPPHSFKMVGSTISSR